jgi:peptide/nickel transport system substrate-binding protein
MSDRKSGPAATSLVEQFAAGKVGRREFLVGATALGFSAAGATSLMTRSAKAAAPMRGGHLRVGTDGGATIDTFDPMQTIGTDHITNSVFSCYDSLTEIDGTGTPVPSLAESWDTSKDGKTWTFKLRKGAEFHNGKSLTADDVIWSMNLHLSEGNKFAEGKQVVSSFETLKADGKDTVVMVQKEVNYDLPAHLSSIGMIIGPEGTTDWDTGIGTGPYALEGFEPGVRFVGKRYPNFYRDDQGFFDSVEVLNIADVANRSNALRTGAVDVIGQPDTKTAKRLDGLDGFSLVEARGAQHFTTAMRTDTDPFTDNNIRLAVKYGIKYGIKREEILNKVFGGFGYIGNDHPIGQNVQFHNDALPQREYDPDKSRFHLKKAGLSEIKLDLTTSDGAFDGAVDMAVLMQASMKDGGINVNVDRVPGDGYWSEVWLKHPWCAVYWNGRPTVDWMLTVGYISSSSWNDTYFKNERFDSVLAAARGEGDQAKRKEMYFELQEILHNEGGTTIPVFASYLHGASDKLAHGAVGGYRRMDDNRLARRWWFA